MSPDKLEKWRKANGLSQPRLAELLGIHPMTISYWERKVQGIPPFLHLALAELERRLAKPKTPKSKK